MKKIVSLLLICVLVLAGCGSNSSADYKPVEITDKVEITFWHAMNGQQEEELKRLTKKYNDSQDKVTVKLQNQGDYTTLESKLTKSADSGDLPTMAMGYSNWMIEYKENDKLVNLQPFYDDTEYGVDSESYVSAFIEETKFDDSYYGMPFNKSTEVMYYNKDLFDEAGIKDTPTTLDELVTTSQTITNKTDKVAVGYDSPSNYLALAIKECGINEWFNEDGEAQFNDSCVTDTVSKYQTGIKDGYMRVAGEDGYLSGPFGNGDLAMNIGSTAGATFIESGVDGKFDWGVAPYPGDVVIQQGTNLMVFNDASEQEASAAWDYMKFLTTDENTAAWAIATGYLPVTKKAYETEEYQKHIKNNETAKVAYEQLDKMEVVIPVFSGSQEIYSTLFKDYMSSVLEAGKDVQKEMDTLQSDSEDVYARNN